MIQVQVWPKSLQATTKCVVVFQKTLTSISLPLKVCSHSTQMPKTKKGLIRWKIISCWDSLYQLESNLATFKTKVKNFST